MIIAQTDLFKGLGKNSLEIISKNGSEKTYGKNVAVFRENTKAENFYILVSGALHLVMGEQEELCFTIDRPGEIFGWSSLISPFHYAATAKTMSESRVVEINRDTVENIIREYPEDGVVIFRNLAAIVTGKLRDVYHQQAMESK